MSVLRIDFLFKISFNKLPVCVFTEFFPDYDGVEESEEIKKELNQTNKKAGSLITFLSG